MEEILRSLDEKYSMCYPYLKKTCTPFVFFSPLPIIEHSSLIPPLLQVSSHPPPASLRHHWSGSALVISPLTSSPFAGKCFWSVFFSKLMFESCSSFSIFVWNWCLNYYSCCSSLFRWVVVCLIFPFDFIPISMKISMMWKFFCC